MAVPAIPSMTGGAGGAAGPSTAKNGDGIFDNSGWTVTFGDNSPATPAAGISTYLPWIALAVGGLVLWKTLRK